MPHGVQRVRLRSRYLWVKWSTKFARSSQLKLQNKEEVPEEELVKDPEAVEEKHLKIAEFEPEGASFEEFLLALGDYTDVVKAKSERWKTLIGQFGK